VFKIGVVSALDTATARVRVVFDDMDNVASYWLPVVHHKTLKDKSYWMPDPGEHVVCLLDENSEEGAVLGAIYSSADAVPVSSADKFHITFDDDTVIEYDRTAHKLTVDVQGDIEATVTGHCNVEAQGNVLIKSATNVTLQAPTIGMNAGSPTTATLDGDFTLTGSLSVTGDISATGTIMDGGGNSNHHSH
jgi:phage baseplate assembly protein V